MREEAVTQSQLNGTKAVDAAAAAFRFSEMCAEKGIVLARADEKKIDSEFRKLAKSNPSLLEKMDFESIVAEIPPMKAIEDYYKKLDEEPAKEESSKEQIPNMESVKENVGAATPEETKITSTEEKKEKLPKEDKKTEVKKSKASTADLAALEALMGGASTVSDERKKEIRKEIKNLTSLRNFTNRNVTMRNEDCAILYAVMKAAAEKQNHMYRDTDITNWTGIMHVAAMALFTQLSEDGETAYIKAVLKEVEQQKKDRRELDDKIDRLKRELNGD